MLHLFGMLVKFQKEIKLLTGEPEKKKFLLAVSGGIDSAVMAELFFKSKYSFAIAHCNFQLRGEESDSDENFVKALADKYDVPFHVKHFDTQGHAENHKVSVQMAARELRYEWLKESAGKHKFDYIVIAHNADDAIETFFINLLRGTGIAGLHGIATAHENILRPLLIFTRKEIEVFAKDEKIKWREDSSNATDKYERNKIRHHLVPLLKEIAPDATKAIRSTIHNLRETELLYRKAIEEKMVRISANSGDKVHISLSGLRKLELPHIYLYEYLKKYGFNHAQVEEICEAINGQPGKVFLSATHRITKDRRYLILEKLPAIIPVKEYYVSKNDGKIENDLVEIELKIKDKPAGYKPFHPPSVACLDYDKLEFPLMVRRWEKGDKFYPLGMSKPKKLSDFLIDEKVSLADKERVYVMLSGKKIAWIIGHRIDDRFKIGTATKKMYICNSKH